MSSSSNVNSVKESIWSTEVRDKPDSYTIVYGVTKNHVLQEYFILLPSSFFEIEGHFVGCGHFLLIHTTNSTCSSPDILE